MKQKNTQPTKSKSIQADPPVRWGLYISAAVTLFIVTCFANNGSYFTEKVLGFLGGAAIFLMLLLDRKSVV